MSVKEGGGSQNVEDVKLKLTEDYQKRGELKCNTKEAAQMKEPSSRNEMTDQLCAIEKNERSDETSEKGFLHFQKRNLIEMNANSSFKRVEQEIEQVLLMLVERDKIDYTCCRGDSSIDCIHHCDNNTSGDGSDSVSIRHFNGRMFGSKTCCSFQIELCSLCSIGDNERKVAMEIHRMSGDGFVFNLFFSLFVDEMIQNKLVKDIPNHSNLPSILDDFAFNPFAFLPDCHKDEEPLCSLCVCFFFLERTKKTVCGNNVYVNWLDMITDENSDEECIRESTVQWLDAISVAKCDSGNSNSKSSDNKNSGGQVEWNANNMNEVVLNICRTEQRFMLDELAEMIGGPFFNVFSIRNVVTIIQETIQLTQSCPLSSALSFAFLTSDPIALFKRIHQLKRRWARALVHVFSCVYCEKNNCRILIVFLNCFLIVFFYYYYYLYHNVHIQVLVFAIFISPVIFFCFNST
ncbi:hypothetical protein RFI_10701 [Reticulomyxa filosa]|uniref:Uncharacterized protein n=1 Tax=Reticulomyxa filosa TaxID=46433 RepID=X6NKE1_RETFI|nr:hypothetical protein RFI_10701 [Reticulomyxa filosa]|eukprot:ETO26436.1 hypothetical protein RFI_10701 [Reticulomyxa filosa]